MDKNELIDNIAKDIRQIAEETENRLQLLKAKLISKQNTNNEPLKKAMREQETKTNEVINFAQGIFNINLDNLKDITKKNAGFLFKNVNRQLEKGVANVVKLYH
jgi:DNA anti-recombination protein RmuC